MRIEGGIFALFTSTSSYEIEAKRWLPDQFPFTPFDKDGIHRFVLKTLVTDVLILGKKSLLSTNFQAGTAQCAARAGAGEAAGTGVFGSWPGVHRHAIDAGGGGLRWRRTATCSTRIASLLAGRSAEWLVAAGAGGGVPTRGGHAVGCVDAVKPSYC
jgi:hypothetical protein